MTFGEKLQDIRKKAGMSQDALAEKLDVSVESVKRYETDVRIPPLHIVKAMADLSGDESLAYRFLAKTTQELDVLPDIEMVNLQAATIRMMNRMARFAAKARDRQLMEIAEDGIISEEEQPLYAEIMDELTGIITAFYQLKFYTEEEKR